MNKKVITTNQQIISQPNFISMQKISLVTKWSYIFDHNCKSCQQSRVVIFKFAFQEF